MTAQTSAQLLQTPDLIHIRFADVLLMHSELTETADGMNRVRARSHLAPIAYSLEALKNERRFELAFEAIRWPDILRWAGPSLESAGQLLNKQTGFTVINEGVVTPMVKYDYAARLKETPTSITGRNAWPKSAACSNPAATSLSWNSLSRRTVYGARSICSISRMPCV